MGYYYTKANITYAFSDGSEDTICVGPYIAEVGNLDDAYLAIFDQCIVEMGGNAFINDERVTYESLAYEMDVDADEVEFWECIF
ncbi:MAG: hypothetical protein IKB96_02260 [Prevotella sp.]|nr:hypothetical protein [Prevotella sp.]